MEDDREVAARENGASPLRAVRRRNTSRSHVVAATSPYTEYQLRVPLAAGHVPHAVAPIAATDGRPVCRRMRVARRPTLRPWVSSMTAK